MIGFQVEVPEGDVVLEKACFEVYELMVTEGIYQKVYDEKKQKNFYRLTPLGEELYKDVFPSTRQTSNTEN